MNFFRGHALIRGGHDAIQYELLKGAHLLGMGTIVNTVKSFPIALLKQQTCSCLLDGHPCLGDRNACQGDREACCKKKSVVK